MLVVRAQHKGCSMSVCIQGTKAHCCAAVQVWKVGSLEAEWVPSQPATAGPTPCGMQQQQPWVCRPTHLDLVLAELAIQQPPGIQGCLASLQICTQHPDRGPKQAATRGKRGASDWQLGWLQTPPQGRLLAQGSSCRASTPLGRAETRRAGQKHATAGQHGPH